MRFPRVSFPRAPSPFNSTHPIVAILALDVGRIRGRRLDDSLQMWQLALDGVDLLHLFGVVHHDDVGPRALQYVLNRLGRIGRIHAGNDATLFVWVGVCGRGENSED